MMIPVKHLLTASCVAVAVQGLSLNDASGVSRRDALIGGAAAAAFGLTSGGLYLPNPAFAAGDAPIAVLGASGRTGALCVASCLRKGIPVRALTRSGEWPPKKIDLNAVDFDGDSTPDGNSLLTVSACDVKDASSIGAAISGCRGAIYAASASRKGGNSNEIDNVGVALAGDACLAANVGRYVVLSSTATTRPKSLGYQFTEMTVAGIMTAKRNGEVAVRDAYAKAKGGASYTIVRPGGLNEPKVNKILGPGALELSQGDVLTGIISRADLAELSVELTLSQDKNLQNTAIEAYYTKGAFPCENTFKDFMTNGAVDRLHGDTYKDLFSGIKPDLDYYVA